MNIHEYQAKELFREFGIPVPKGISTARLSEVPSICSKLGKKVVIKAQIHAGGRGQGGGVRLAQNTSEARRLAREILGMTLVTRQTGPRGKVVGRLLIEEAVEIDKEYYVAVTLDRASGLPVLILSSAGGMDIEEVAKKHPKRIQRKTIDPCVGLEAFEARKLAYALGMKGKSVIMAAKCLTGLVQMYLAKDASLAEINPLVLTKTGEALAADAKVVFDENALYRHPDLQDLRDPSEEDRAEREATLYHLNYIHLDGNIGCMVNGAGLAMATMDVIKMAGGEPANFLDVGGGATEETVENAFRIILQDKQVKAILINIFGGIVRCDRVARGVAAAVEKLQPDCPVVVRLSGTNAEEGRKILEESHLSFRTAGTLVEGAKYAVESIKG